ncbi:maestro heat-like repeat-containing protein family member 1 [Carcharodon carcharias]|uniref:maestro heat-like repeat-containing protein family member 1 n=1 Tax=Carcharodon carcharias TaxID=13397 RepID=UPI001B7E15D4|nr:maestro heat-like repeat-containing protein family member 1 [Carcharodon carcharias]
MAACSVEHSLTALRDAACDKDEAVRQQIVQSLRELGGHHVELVLVSCHNYLSKHSQLEEEHRVAILQSMELVVKDAGSQVSELLAKKLIAAAAEGLVKPDEALSEGSKAALSDLLVALGGSFVEEVLDEMLHSFKPDVLPDAFVVRTVARLSVANVQGMTPYLATVFEAVIPMLGLAKPDRMKAALAAALGLLSRSVLKCQDGLPDPTLKKEAFFQEIHAAYDTLFNAWLPLKDPRLRMEILSALGDMVHVMSSDKLLDEVPKLIPAIASFYKKQHEPFYITSCLRQILEVASKMDARALDSPADGLLHSLHHQICLPLDPENELAARNHSELLGCFAALARVSADLLLKFLLHKLANNERGRLGTLAALRHLITAVPAELEGKQPAILAGMRAPLQDANTRTKKVVLEVIEAMAAHGYLELEGGLAMVEFVICQCSLPDSRRPPAMPKPGELTEGELKAAAQDLMGQLAATEKMVAVLWPSLLEFVTPVQYTNALAVVCRSLEHLATRKRRVGMGLFELNYDTRPSLPSPQALVARLLVVASLPYEGRGRGVPALKLLLALSPTIHPALEKLWAQELPVLLRYVADHSEETAAQQQWEKNLLLVLFKTLEVVADSRWTCRLGEEMTNHINAWHSAIVPYPHVSREKQFLYKCLGIVLQHTNSTEVINQQLQEMLFSVQHGEALEREGVAIGVGFCAMTHFEKTLARLEEFVKLDALKKTVNFFNTLMEKVDGDMEKMKSTLILCYGYVALYAPEDLLLPRMEAGILQHVVNLSNTKVLGIKIESKDLMIKLSLIKAVTLIAKAILSNKWRPSYAFTRKGELLTSMQSLIKAECRTQLKGPVRYMAMAACTFLIKLEPPLNRAYVTELIKTCLDSVLGLQPLVAERGKEESAEEKEREGFYQETLAALQGLLNEILLRVLSPDGLQAVFKHVEGWIISTKDHERERALDVTSKLMEVYLERMVVHSEVEFTHLGTIVGRLVPRCTDPVLKVRQLAMGSIYSLFYIHQRYAGLRDGDRDELIEHLKAIGARLDQSDSQVLLRVCSDLAKVIARRLPQDQVSTLLFVLFEGLDDHYFSCSSAASIVMNTIIRSCGTVLESHVSEILKALYIRLQWIAGEQVKLSMIHFICVLASQNTAEVVSCLLCSPIPFDRHTSDIWRALAGEPTLATRTMELLMEALGKHLMPSERAGSLVHKSGALCSALEPLAIICALSEMLVNPESAAAVKGLYPQLFSTLLLHLSSSVGVEFPKELFSVGSPKEWKISLRSKQSTFDVCNYSLETLKAVLTAGRDEGVVAGMEEAGGWSLVRSSERHHEGVALLAQAMARHVRPQLAGIAHQLTTALPSAPKSLRVTLTAFLGELLSQPVVSELQLTDVLLASLLGCANDVVPIVRLLCLRGLGGVLAGDPQKVGLYAPKLVGAMISGISEGEDPRDLVKLEAMGGLSQLLAHLEERSARSLLADIILAAQPLFENGNERVRTEAFALFGSLSRFGEGELRRVYAEQVHASLVSLILHVNDGDAQVAGACRAALRSAGPLLGSDSLAALFQGQLDEEAGPDYWAFLDALSKLIAADLPAKASIYLAVGVTFFKSLLPEIRGNAVMFTACLLQKLPRKYHQAVTNGNICVDIVAMMQDPVPSVRLKVAKALSLLH